MRTLPITHTHSTSRTTRCAECGVRRHSRGNRGTVITATPTGRVTERKRAALPLTSTAQRWSAIASCERCCASRIFANVSSDAGSDHPVDALVLL